MLLKSKGKYGMNGKFYFLDTNAIIYFKEISQVLNNIMNYIEEKKLA